MRELVAARKVIFSLSHPPPSKRSSPLTNNIASRNASADKLFKLGFKRFEFLRSIVRFPCSRIT